MAITLRLCGMQVFNVVSGKYRCHNKYYGRGLSPAGFRMAIEEFFNNSDKPELIVSSFISVFEIVKSKDTFKFFRESILPVS